MYTRKIEVVFQKDESLSEFWEGAMCMSLFTAIRAKDPTRHWSIDVGKPPEKVVVDGAEKTETHIHFQVNVSPLYAFIANSIIQKELEDLIKELTVSWKAITELAAVNLLRTSVNLLK